MEGFRIEERGGILVVRIKKELDHHLARQIREAIDPKIDCGRVKTLVFDFQGVSFMDSSGIGMIMGRYKKLQFFGGKTKVSGISPEIERIFSMSGLYQLVPKYSDVESAIASIF